MTKRSTGTRKEKEDEKERKEKEEKRQGRACAYPTKHT
jgi:hypothetical protein